jgi:arylsulfatase A
VLAGAFLILSKSAHPKSAPFIARWPGHIKPHTNNFVITFAAAMPTLAKIAGGKPPTKIDSLDFSPTLLGQLEQPQLTDRMLHWEPCKYDVYSQASRWKRWKAVRDLAAKKTELYDLSSDLAETHNLAAGHADLIAKFHKFVVDVRSDSTLWP